MKLVSFSAADGKIRPGALLEEGNLVADLGAAGYANTLDVIASGVRSVDRPGTYPGYRLSEAGHPGEPPVTRRLGPGAQPAAGRPGGGPDHPDWPCPPRQ